MDDVYDEILVVDEDTNIDDEEEGPGIGIMPVEWTNAQATQALNHLSNISSYTNTTSTRVNTLNTTLTQTNTLLNTVNQNLTVIAGKVDYVMWLVALFLCFYVAQYFLRRLFYRG